MTLTLAPLQTVTVTVTEVSSNRYIVIISDIYHLRHGFPSTKSGIFPRSASSIDFQIAPADWRLRISLTRAPKFIGVMFLVLFVIFHTLFT